MTCLTIRAWLLAGLLASVPGPVRSQVPSPDSARTVGIGPVVVRVLRTGVEGGAPHPISVASGPWLTRATRGAFLEDALRAVPGVQIHNRFNLAQGERVAVRGFGPRAQFGVRGVRVLVDGIPATRPDGQTTLDHVDLAWLGRVEALRGPGASLYGNAAGGVLHLRTRPPPGRSVVGRLRLLSGSHGLDNVQGALSGTLGDVGYHVGGSRLTYDGFRANPVTGDGVYGTAERRVLNAIVTAPWGRGSVRLVLNGVDLDAENPGSLSKELLSQGDRQAFRFNVLRKTRKDVRQGQVGVIWTGALRSLDAEVAGWALHRSLDNPIPSRVIDLNRRGGGFRALARRSVTTPLGVLALGGGVELELQRDDRKNFVNEDGTPGARTLDQQERVRSLGFFLQGRLTLTESLAGTAGLRYDRFRFEATDRRVGGDDPDDSGGRSMDAISPSVGFVLSPLPRLELFANVATSFETPTTTELVNRPSGGGGFNPALEPQKAWTLEGGLRGRAGDHWTFEATAFRTNLRDQLVPFEVADEPGRTFFRNAGRSRHKGWELAVDGRPHEAISLRAAYTRVDGRFVTFVGEEGDHSGNRIPGLAPHRADVALAWESALAFFEVRGLYQDDVPVDDANLSSSPAWFVADVRAGLARLSLGATPVSPFVGISNVFDRTYNASVVVNAFGSRYFEPGPGRTFHAGVSVEWPGG